MNIKLSWLTINRNCNLSCHWCYSKEYLNNYDIMPLDLSKKLIDISFESGVQKIFLIGGEPTINPYLFEILQYIIALDLEIVIVTNGIMLADKSFCNKIVDLNYNKLHFGISIKGSSDDYYKNNCGIEGYKLILNGISNCKEYNLKYSLSYVLSTDNIDSLDEFASQLRKDGVKEHISFSICNDIIRKDGSVIKDWQHPLKIDRVFADKYNDICKILNDKFTLHQVLPLCQCTNWLLDEMIKKNQIITTCHVHIRNGAIFDTDGSLLLCNHLAGFNAGKYGVDFWDHQSFCAYWESENAISLHTKLTNMPTLECKKCDKSSQCGGGCCVQWFSNDFNTYRNYI